MNFCVRCHSARALWQEAIRIRYRYAGIEGFAAGVLLDFGEEERPLVHEVHDDTAGDLLHAEATSCFQAALSGDEPLLRSDDNGLEEAKARDAVRQFGEVSEIAAESAVDLDFIYGEVDELVRLFVQGQAPRVWSGCIGSCCCTCAACRLVDLVVICRLLYIGISSFFLSELGFLGLWDGL